MTHFRIAFNGLVIGLFLSLMVWRFTWLQMRIAPAILIPVGFALTYACYFYYGKKLQQNWAIFRFQQTLVMTVVMIFLLLLLYGTTGLITITGATLRDPFHAMWSFGVVATVVTVLLILGLFGLAVSNHRHPVAKLGQSDSIKQLTLQSKVGLLATIAVIVLLVISYAWVPPFHHFADQITGMLIRLDIGSLRDYINSFGFWGPLISALIMVFQSVMAPLPAFLLTFTNAYLYGWFWGMVLSWSSAMVGAIVCFYIARGIGRPFAEKVITKRALYKIDHFFDEYGKYTVMVLRLLPFVSFDEVSYGAGFTSMKLIPFLVGTGIGQLPATFVYSLFGGSLNGNRFILFMAIIAFMLLIVFLLVARKVIQNRHKKSSSHITN